MHGGEERLEFGRFGPEFSRALSLMYRYSRTLEVSRLERKYKGSDEVNDQEG